MKNILKKIIDTYFDNDITKYKLILDDSLLVILDDKGKESDFFYFIFEEEENIENIKSQEMYETLKESDTNKEFKDIESFEKNLNFIYFIKREVYKNDDILNVKAHLIEENPYYAKEKVIFYTDKLVENFTNFSLETKEIKSLNESMSEEYMFLLDLLVGLTFIKIDFSKNIGTSIENNIFEKSYGKIDGEYKYSNIFTDTAVTDTIKINNEENFRKSIINIKEKSKLSNYDKVIKTDISEFEKDLLNLFGEGKNSLTEHILSFKVKDNENK